ncbi:MAG: ABC transporter permease [Ureaplasma sp.]|nr:ABC transporter permease [Ureaplasma sp.]MDE6289819.1 ABC transporter permease [Ureaplasma sp.]
MDFNLILNSAMLFSTILILGAISGYFSERVGIANISINGQMTFGAMIFTIFAGLFQPLGDGTFVVPLLLGTILAVASSTLFGYLTIKLKSDQIVAGTAINLVVAGLGTFLTSPLGPIVSGGAYPKLTSNYNSMLEINGSGIYGTTVIIFLLVLILVAGLYYIIRFTPFGLRLRAIGNNPNAVDAQGVNVARYQWISLTIGGLLAGLAGGLFMFQKGGTFDGDVSGYGFLALAILIAGSWRIPLIVAASIIFAIINTVFKNITSIPSDVGKMLPYLITLVGMIAFSKWNVAPKNIGIPFDKTKR